MSAQGHKQTSRRHLDQVCFTPKSGHSRAARHRPLSANNGHRRWLIRSRVAIYVDLLRRDVGILFVSAVYCDANVWRYFLFGAIFVRLRRERQALLRAREPPSIRRSMIKPSIASTK
jgi:hypothetical protein